MPGACCTVPDQRGFMSYLQDANANNHKKTLQELGKENFPPSLLFASNRLAACCLVASFTVRFMVRNVAMSTGQTEFKVELGPSQKRFESIPSPFIRDPSPRGRTGPDFVLISL